MPIQKSASVCPIRTEERANVTRPKTSMTKNQALLLLRQKEILAYHYICEVFRAQGHLTTEKLKLLKEIAAALYIPEVRHKAECHLAICTKELNEIAEWVAGPGTEVEWRKESIDRTEPIRPVRIDTASLRLADAVAAAINDHLSQMDDSDMSVVTKTITLSTKIFEKDFEEPKIVKKPTKKLEKPATSTPSDDAVEGSSDEAKGEDKDGDSTSSAETKVEISDSKKEEKNESITQHPKKMKTTPTKEEIDANLMPPPPPVIIVPAPIQPPPSVLPIVSPPSPPLPVITVPPPTDMTVVTPTVTTPETSEVPQIVESPIAEIPVLTEAEEAQARADFFSSLPPLVVVPPPDPSEASSLPSPSLCSPSLVLSPGFQIRDENRRRKRSLSQSQSQDTVVVTAAKTIALSSYSKVTPVMVSAATAVSSQAQVKVTPIISRAKMATTPQTQKVIIVSNSPTSSTPILQRSLNVPMGSLGLPLIRANQPRFQPITGTSSCTLRPKMVTVPAKCRAKGSSMVNLQLKNAITLKQDNVTVVDTSVKRLPGPTKILPKPTGSMFIVNTGQGAHKLTTAVGGGREGTKQNVVIVQKGANQRTLTLSNPNKDLMQKLMSKKCVVIQSSKVVPKTISPKPPTPAQPAQSPTAITTTGNTVVLDLSQEPYRQNLGSTTVREILQAAGIITHPAPAQNPPTLTEAAQVSSGEGEWLPVETSKTLSLEEVSLPIGQSESFVTLDEAVEMLEDQHTDGGVSFSEGEGLSSANPEPVFTITSDQLSSGNLRVVADKSDPMTSQIVMETFPSEVPSDLDCVSQPFLPHQDGAVTIQHSNIDVPANMSLEDYSSQQMENQNF